MRKESLARLAGAFAAVSLLAPAVASAQRRDRAPARAERDQPAARVAEAGDKTGGEEEEIREREEWFIRSRGLRDVARPDLLRASAVADLAVRRAARAAELQALGQVWQPVGPVSMTMLNWTMGPVAGRVAALAVHPTNEDILYLGTASGGLWKTTDGGSSWASIFDEGGTMTMGAVALQESDPNVVWVGTGERQSSCASYMGMGVFRSTDGGATFQARNGGGTTALELSWVDSIAIHPTSPDTVLAAGEGFCLPDGTRVGGGIFKTTDGGLSWRRVKSGAGSDVLYDTANPSTVYATVNSEGVYKSGDGGETWALANGGVIAPSAYMRIAMAPTDHAVLYVVGSNSQLYRTANGATSWTNVNSTACEGQCTYNLTIDVSPTNPDQIMVGSIRHAQSFNGGGTLPPMTSGWGSSQAVHQDTHVVRYSRTNGSRFWVGTDGGLWRTDTGGFNYTNLNSNLILTQFYDVAMDPGNPARLFGGAQDNSSEGRFGSQQWNVTEVTGDGFMNAIDPNTLSRVFQTSYPSGGTPSVYRSTSSGNVGTFNRLATNGIVVGEPFPWVTPLNVLTDYVFVGSHSVYRGNSTQATGSFTWQKISGDLSQGGQSISVITFHPPRTTPFPGIDTGWGAYVGTSNGRIARGMGVNEANPGFRDVTGNYPGGYVSDLAVDPVDPERVYVTRGAFNLSRLYRSKSGGFNWMAVGTGLPNVPANAVAVDPSDPRRVFVGTDIGVYESADFGDTFQPLAQGMPLGTVVTDLEIDDNPHVLVAGTYGRGAYRVDLVAIPNVPPAAAFAHQAEGLVARFTDQTRDADGEVESRLWLLGDGTVSTEADPSHRYARPGSYWVTLIATDDRAASSQASALLTVGAETRRRYR